MDTSRAERHQCVSRYPPFIYIYTPQSYLLYALLCTQSCPLVTRTTFNVAQHRRLWRLSLTRTPNVHIEFAYLLRPSSDAFIRSWRRKPHPKNRLPDLASLRNHLPHTHPCRLVTAKIFENDAIPRLSSPFRAISLPKGAAPHKWL